MDPVGQGARLRIVGGADEGDSGLVALPAGRWHAKGRVFRYADAAGTAAGVRSVILRIGRKGGILRIAGRGAWPYAIDRPQTELTVTLSIGAARWCAFASPCRSATGPCAPEPGAPFLVTTNYADPDVVHWNPPLELDGDDAARTFKYCARYDNGEADPSTVKRRSTSPAEPFGPICATSELACFDGPHQGMPCDGNDAVCDSSPGLGDGLCDACVLHGGVTTDDEMFIMLGSYFCETGSACEAGLEP